MDEGVGGEGGGVQGGGAVLYPFGPLKGSISSGVKPRVTVHVYKRAEETGLFCYFCLVDFHELTGLSHS